MNESIKTLETRCSCKAYTDKMIPEDILQEILVAALVSKMLQLLLSQTKRFVMS